MIVYTCNNIRSVAFIYIDVMTNWTEQNAQNMSCFCVASYFVVVC